jgi:hypothetical protein
MRSGQKIKKPTKCSLLAAAAAAATAAAGTQQLLLQDCSGSKFTAQ